MEEKHFTEYFCPHMEKLGYKCIYKKKTGNKGDGCALFFKKVVFSLDSYTAVEYKKMNVPTLDRDNIGIIAFLRPIDERFSNLRLCVATTHLIFNPKRGDVKLSQLRIFFAEIEKLTFVTSTEGMRLYSPIILCGDMNSEPFSPLYNFICCGEIHYEGMITGNVSGQEDGHNKGRIMTVDLLDLSGIGVSNETQYIKNVSQNALQSSNGIVQLENSDMDGTLPSLSAISSSEKALNETAAMSKIDPLARQNIFDVSSCYKAIEMPRKCYFSHHLHFDTAYRHSRATSTVKEVTTQNKMSTCTVDYIFYTLKHKRCVKLRGLCTMHANKLHGELKLIGNYGLLCSSDIKEIGGLPNAYLPSDHLCLISRFVLCAHK